MKKVLFLSLVFLFGCGFGIFNNGKKAAKNSTASKKIENKIPRFYVKASENPDHKKNFILATGTGLNETQQGAEMLAFSMAQGKLVQQIKSQTKFLSENVIMVGGTDYSSKLSSITQVYANETIKGSNPVTRTSAEKQPNGSMLWRCYLVLEYDERKAAKNLLEEAKKEAELYEAIKLTNEGERLLNLAKEFEE